MACVHPTGLLEVLNSKAHPYSRNERDKIREGFALNALPTACQETLRLLNSACALHRVA